MPYQKVRHHPQCSEGQVAVVKIGDGRLMGCHNNEADADRQLAALHAAEPKAK